MRKIKKKYLLIFPLSGFVFLHWTLISLDKNTKIINRVPLILNYEEHIFNWFPVFNLRDQCQDYCEFSNNISLYNEARAVIFYRTLKQPPPPVKPQNQIWIFFTFESPVNTDTSVFEGRWKDASRKFNWLMSYRQNADIIIPFGRLEKLNDNFVSGINYTEIYQQKTKDVAWIVSNCESNSKREIYVNELKKYINVDVFGYCGTMQCPTRKNNKWEEETKCKVYLSRKYKFYLSFENSLCYNYATEKTYAMYSRNVFSIPVVRGAPNISNLLPEGTYISTNNFKSPRKLADYLLYVGSSEERYTRYLKEKHKYNVTLWTTNYYPAICDLCTKIKSTSTISKTSIDIKARLSEDKCVKPSDTRYYKPFAYQQGPKTVNI